MMNRLISIAPMMDCTDRHCRYFLRIIAPHVLLYTEMISVQALLYGDVERHLGFHSDEHPIALQLGGNDPKQLSYSAKLGEEWGYDEINLNVGCPSDRVKKGRIGACLMLEPQLVADGVAAMKDAVAIPISVKCRIGVDDHDSYEKLYQFIHLISQAGCSIFIIHARKAWLTGLNPKQNRTIPPLEYDKVRRIKKDFPHLTIIINGGIQHLEQVSDHLRFVDGIMIGREAYSNPFFLSEIEQKYFSYRISREEVVDRFIPYVEEQLKQSHKLATITRHILGLYHNQKNARTWRRMLSENAHRRDAGVEVIQQAMNFLAAVPPENT